MRRLQIARSLRFENSSIGPLIESMSHTLPQIEFEPSRDLENEIGRSRKKKLLRYGELSNKRSATLLPKTTPGSAASSHPSSRLRS